MSNFIVMISGRGSNLEAICKAGLSSKISCVISNNPNALGLEIAKTYSIPTAVINHKNYTSRKDFEHSLIKTIDEYTPQLIVLAGFMRILGSLFVNKYWQKIINIHPSLLPSFIGVNAQEQAFNAKVKLSGATVHFVTNKLDYGPIIAQGIIPIEQYDTSDSVASKILKLEHKLYPFAIQKIINKQVAINSSDYVVVEKDDKDFEHFGDLRNCIFY